MNYQFFDVTIDTVAEIAYTHGVIDLGDKTRIKELLANSQVIDSITILSNAGVHIRQFYRDHINLIHKCSFTLPISKEKPQTPIYKSIW